MSLRYNPQTGEWRGETYAEQTQAATRNAMNRRTLDSIKITKLDAEGVPAGEAVTVTGRIKINEPPLQAKLTPMQQTERERNLKHLGAELGLPSFLQDEFRREDEHAWQVRRDKKRKELAEMYGEAPAKWLDAAADQQTPRILPWQPVEMPEISIRRGGLRFPATSPSVTGGWAAPSETLNNLVEATQWCEGPYDGPELRPVYHPCKLFPYGENEPQQEESHTSMYTDEAQRIAMRQLQEERDNREAEEIISRIKAFGEDVYADGTVFRVTRQFFRSNGTLIDPEVYAILRSTDVHGRTKWADDTGAERPWSLLVNWFVTDGKPVTLDDVEVFPPAKFPAGTQVETTITGTVQ